MRDLRASPAADELQALDRSTAAPRAPVAHLSASGGTVRPVRKLSWALVAIWGAAITLGLGLLLGYSLMPGQPAHSPPQWPARVTFARSMDRPQLVMLAHPHCPCTRASIAELSWIMTRLKGRVAATVLFFEGGETQHLERSEHWTSAAQIEGVRVVADPEGRAANAFGAFTSGQVYLYDSAGVLRFSGGITPSRAHQGANVGRQRIIDLVTAGAADRDRSAVYGCGLRSPELAGPWWSWLKFNR